MSVQSVTLNIPTALYAQLKKRAEQAHRTVEEELLTVVSNVLYITKSLGFDNAT